MTNPTPFPLLIGHAERGVPYHEPNSFRGLSKTAAQGLNAQDVDLLLSRDGRAVATHWKRPLRHGFRDPLGRIRSATLVSRLPLRKLHRLRADPGGYRIHTLAATLRFAATIEVHGRPGEPFTICGELKPDRRWRNTATFEHIVRAAERNGTPIIIMSQPRMLGRGMRYLRAARRAGLPVLLLTRFPIPPWWIKDLDYAKGPSRWANRPGVVWFGPGSPNGGTRLIRSR